jgi:acetoin utilization deacetylase AcuC-like enzyme
MPRAPVFLAHPSSLEHDTGPHPEQPARITAIENELDRRGWLGYERISSPEVSRQDLAAVHPESYIATIERISERGGAQLDPDTVVGSGSFEAALHAAGGAVALVDLLIDGDAPSGFSAHRPPGHHAEPAIAMGFCLFNNMAIAARHALSQRGLERVLILDWDVHHGNGTNDIFHADPGVLFVSIHQWPLYPGTGRASDIGEGEGTGYTVNLPVPGGSGDAVYRSLVDRLVVPLARAYKPQLVLVSAGYDAHVDDPLAGCQVTDEGFGAMAASVRRVCAELEVPFGAVLEGGYALGALARPVGATMEAFAGAPEVSVDGELPITPITSEAVRRVAELWPALAGD